MVSMVNRLHSEESDGVKALRVAPKVTLTSEEQSELARIVDSRLSRVKLSQRAQTVLLAAGGLQNTTKPRWYAARSDR
ncbi:protein of unknown function [Acidithiobacillus ferrivorans]|uniref:Regulatory protein LuxR n=1 Tax=Acidithiobacillus ferrivorans TaxID=160808 RepID=A0A060UNX3_9PROT